MMIYVKFIFFIVGLCYGITAYSSETIQVQAEGSGTSKIEATKNAWLEAVRQAVGIYMSSKTVVLDDEITESIAAYSRGQVESYKVVKSEQNADGWHIVILANIEKDVLQEETKKVSLKKQTLEFDGTSDVAKKITKEDKKKRASDVILSMDRLDFKDSIVYKAEIKSENYKGRKVYYVRHYIGLDIKQVLDKLNKFEKIIEKIAFFKKEFYFNKNHVQKNKEIANFDISFKKFSLERFDGENLGGLFSGDAFFRDDSFIDHGHHDAVIKYQYEEKYECIDLVNSVSKSKLYCFETDSLFRCKIPNELSIVFKVENSDGELISISNPVSLIFHNGGSTLVFQPYMRKDNGFGPFWSYFLYFDQEINLTDEDMFNTKQISASYEIIEEEHPWRECR